MEDTIAAIATPPGTGGIGIIRVSGPKAKDIARLLFRPSRKMDALESHRLYHGQIVSAETSLVIDEVLISFMMKPHSYTGEDTLEINCHGGSTILQMVLNEIIRSGIRPAEPGEFTRRAFLNNRMDLSQAEAIYDMITARTEAGLALALSHFKGELSEKVKTLQASMIDVLSLIETSLDFSDEDAGTIDASKIVSHIQSIVHTLNSLTSTYKEGKIFKDGISAVVAGRPNVGKSSLLNRLLGEKRAIVTSIPGTTRDFIEEIINLKGIPVKITDTAGIREPENLIEEEGIGLVRRKLQSADIIMIVLDGSAAVTQEDLNIIHEYSDKPLILIINKTDLPHAVSDQELNTLVSDQTLHPLWISAKYGEGISELKDAIYSLAMSQCADHRSDHVITNIRHKTAIERASLLLSKAECSLLSGLSYEFAALDVREALDCLGEIPGKTINDEVLDRIFSNFCIGK